jgi:CheY-like chemotaxis protein
MRNKVDSVCIIDDDLIYQFLAKEEIEYTNLVGKIMFFDDGEKAIHFLAATLDNNDVASLPDVIFLDINMPIMDGWEFLEAYLLLKPRIGKNIVIYIVSSSIDIRDLDKARSISEVSDYIIKPISNKRLVSIFSELLA